MLRVSDTFKNRAHSIKNVCRKKCIVKLCQLSMLQGKSVKFPTECENFLVFALCYILFEGYLVIVFTLNCVHSGQRRSLLWFHTDPVNLLWNIVLFISLNEIFNLRFIKKLVYPWTFWIAIKVVEREKKGLLQPYTRWWKEFQHKRTKLIAQMHIASKSWSASHWAWMIRK